MIPSIRQRLSLLQQTPAVQNYKEDLFHLFKCVMTGVAGVYLGSRLVHICALPVEKSAALGIFPSLTAGVVTLSFERMDYRAVITGTLSGLSVTCLSIGPDIQTPYVVISTLFTLSMIELVQWIRGTHMLNATFSAFAIGLVTCLMSLKGENLSILYGSALLCAWLYKSMQLATHYIDSRHQI